MHAASPNHQYRLVWNEGQQAYVAVPETASGRGQRGRGAALLLAVALLAGAGGAARAAELPAGGQITAGQGSIVRSGSTLTVTQTSDRLAADWQSFSIGAGHSVRFVQPSASAAALNRVTGSEPSVIQGALTANGQVFLVNPNGVLFTPTAQVNAGGLVASALDLSAADFMAGRLRFAGPSTAAVRNEGRIDAPGGTVALVAARIENTGRISADRGSVLMGAGQRVRLDLGGPARVEVEEGALDALIEQGGAVRADGGRVLLTARAAGDLAASAINHSGVTEARTLATGETGTIELLADMAHGSVRVGGTLDASAPHGGAGGFIETSAARVQIGADLRLSTLAAQGRTGQWLIDPSDYRIAASGGDISGAQLGALLASSDIAIESVAGANAGQGDILVDDRVAWSANELTLRAQRHILINAPLVGTGTARLALEYGLAAPEAGNGGRYVVNAAVTLPAGPNFSTRLGSDGATRQYTVITELGAPGSTSGADLQGINGALGGHYALGADIDASATLGWNGGAGFAPLGVYGATAFSGSFDGLGHQITGLSIQRPFDTGVGLFGATAAGALVRHVGLAGTSLNGAAGVGPLVGINEGRVDTSHASGSTRGGTNVGGLVGLNTGSGVVQNSHSGGDLVGGNRLGGLVGVNNGSVLDSYSVVTVRDFAAQDLFGGLVGQNGGTVQRSYSAGIVDVWVPANNAGSLIGHNGGTVSDSYWNADVAARPGVAGVGLAGIGSGTTAGATGLDSAQMQQASSFAGFAFGTTPGEPGRWVIVNADGSLNGHGSEGGGTTPMLASEYSATVRNAHQLQLMAMTPAAHLELAADIDARATAVASAPNADVWGSAGFVPIGNGASSAFSGRFDGQGHTITGLTIDRPGAHEVGLFGLAHNASIANVGLVGGRTAGRDGVGALVGALRSSGGQASSIVGSHASGDVSGTGYNVGGLVGELRASDSGDSVRVERSSASGSVDGAVNNVGGLVGLLYTRHAAASITVENSFASGAVRGGDVAGGLVGYVAAEHGSIGIDRSFATGATTTLYGGARGGLAGALETRAPDAGVTLHRSFWDTQTSGVASAAGQSSRPGGGVIVDQALGRTTAEMGLPATFAAAGWDIVQDASLPGDDPYPRLRLAGGSPVWTIRGPVELSFTLGLAAGEYVYQGTEYSLGGLWSSAAIFGSDYAGWVPGVDYTFQYQGSSITGFTNAGTYDGIGISILRGGFVTAGSGNTAGSFTIAKAPLTVTADPQTRTYGGANPLFTTTISGFVNGETLATAGVTGSGAAASSAHATTPAGTAVITAGIGTLASGNYDFTTFVDGTLTITKANATVTANSAATTYNGQAQSVTGFTATGLVNGETEAVLTGVTTTGGSGLNAGSYVHSASGMDGNYNLSFVDGSLTIAKANATVTANSASTVYNGLTQSVSGFTATGLVNGETVAVLTGVTTAGGSGRNAGTYVHSASGTDGNYNLSFVDGSLTIGKANATVTANSGSTTYNGLMQSVGGFTAAGLVNGETAAVLTGVTTTGGSGRNAGSYVHSASGTDGNYNLSFVDGSLTIGKANATVTANSGSTTYNGLMQSVGGFTAAGLVNGETAAVLTGVTTSGGSGRNAGSYVHSANGTDGNYNLSFVDGSLTIAKANATVTANSASTIYNGLTQSVSGFTATGLVDGETTAVLTGVTTTGGSGLNAGTYVHSASGTDGNYNLSFVDGSLTIGKANATVTANSGSTTYNGLMQSVGGFTAAGLVNGETAAVLTGVTTSGGSGRNAGSYVHSANGTDGNYNLSFVDGSLTIAKANATVTANSASTIYNGLTQSVSGFTATGLVDGETTAVLTGVTTTGGSGLNAGTYVHSASGTDGNYNLSFVDGSLTIGKANATVTANSGSTTYNGLMQSVNGFTATGLVDGETTAVLTGVTTTGGRGRNAGSYVHSASGTDGNYNLSFVDGSLTIGKASATVTANSASTTYNGQVQSVGGFTATGLVNGETAAVLTGVTTTGGSGLNAGTYVHSARGTDGNYNLSFVDGSLTIAKADATVTANSAATVYNGLTQSVSGFTATGLVNGETAGVLTGVTTIGGSGRNAGSYVHSATGTDGNYNLSFVDGSLTIAKADATVTANSAATVYNGLTQSVSGFTATGLVNGETAGVLTGVTTIGGSGRNAGSYVHSATGTDGNYNLSFVDGSLTIAKADATVTANSAATVYNGLTQSVSGFTATGLVNGETAGVLAGVTTIGGSGRNAGSYVHSASGTDGNYNLSFVDGSLTIAKADATVTANSAATVYNGLTQSVSGFTATGLVNGETAAVLTGVTTTGGSGRNAGNYVHGASGTDGNYNLRFVDGALTIDPRPVTVVADGQRKRLGQPDPALGYSTHCGGLAGDCGLVPGEVLRGSLVREGALAFDTLGAHAILQGSLDSANNPDYRIHYVGAWLDILPLPLPQTAATTASQRLAGPVPGAAGPASPAVPPGLPGLSLVDLPADPSPQQTAGLRGGPGALTVLVVQGGINLGTPAPQVGSIQP